MTDSPIRLTMTRQAETWLAPCLEMSAEELPADVAAAAWGAGDLPWDGFLPEVGMRHRSCYWEKASRQRVDFGRKTGGPGAPKWYVSLRYAATMIRSAMCITRDGMIVPHVAILLPSSAILLKAGTVRECLYIKSPLASAHDALRDIDTIQQNFPGRFELAA